MAQRKAHLLKQTKNNPFPTSVIFFDCETVSLPESSTVSHHMLKLGIAHHYRALDGGELALQSELIFKEPQAFHQWLENRAREKSTTYIVAHNIVYDLSMVKAWTALPAKGWILESFYTKGITSLFRWRKGTRKLNGLDNTNLFPGSLERWGEILGIPKLKIDFRTCTEDELIVYCRRDVEICARLWVLWLGFLKANDCGGFKPTVGSTAFNTWRHRFLGSSVYIHNDIPALELERLAYKGARTEVFFQGRREDGPFYYLDINNMYGYVLSRYEFPVGFQGYTDKADVSYLIRKLAKYSVIAQVALDTTSNPFPYVYNKHTCYPTGKFVTTLTTPELILALRSGWVVATGPMAWYRSAPLFRDYVIHWFDERKRYRKEKNSGYAEICKLLINSLYGKFGQTGLNQEVIGTVDPEEVYSMSVYDVDKREFYRHIALGGTLYRESKTGESFHSSPAIAAHVTAFARLYLYSLIERAGRGHVFYCDTDSLLVDESGYAALQSTLDNDRLGMLKVELQTPWMEIRAPKDYAVEGRERIKGIRSNAIRLDDKSFIQEQWDRLPGMIESGDLLAYHVKSIKKSQVRQIFSGTVDRSGWVIPYCLEEYSLLAPAPVSLGVSRGQERSENPL